MALEALAFPEPPANLDLEDGGTAYNMGIRFQVAEEIECHGVEWWVPTTVSAPPLGNHQASIWTEIPTKLAAANFVPVPGGKQQALFEDPITLVPGTDYIAAVYTIHYVFTPSGGVWPSTPSGSAVADIGRLTAYAGGPDNVPAAAPLGTSTGLFHVSPLVGTIDEEPGDRFTEGTAGLTLGAAAAVATSRSSSGSVALTATATAACSSARATTGRAELAVGASAARSTVRTTAGVARLLLDAYGTQVRGGGGPRLVTVGRASRLTSVARPDAITTSTRG